MTTAANKIQLKGDFRYEEAIAGGALTPGHLIEIYNAAGTLKVRVHPTEGGRAERAFAIENGLEGPRPGATPGGMTIDTAYAAGELVPYIVAARGSVVQAFLKGGVNYPIGTKLVSAGDGTLQTVADLGTSTLESDIIGVVEEALDLDASAGVAAARAPVRIV